MKNKNIMKQQSDRCLGTPTQRLDKLTQWLLTPAHWLWLPAQRLVPSTQMSSHFSHCPVAMEQKLHLHTQQLLLLTQIEEALRRWLRALTQLLHDVAPRTALPSQRLQLSAQMLLPQTHCPEPPAQRARAPTKL
ncbi:MAG: hypothetical protein D4R43_00845 [Sphingobacteriales bacterium]|nr:MAG: hypothetical protein D4R43_00845 [Sphingobacteriales bacterium]